MTEAMPFLRKLILLSYDPRTSFDLIYFSALFSSIFSSSIQTGPALFPQRL